MLSELGGGGHAGDTGDTHGRIEGFAGLLADEVHEPAAGDAAHSRDGQGQNAQDEDDAHRGIQDGARLAQAAEHEAQKQRGEAGDATLEQLLIGQNLCLLHGHAEEERQHERSGHGQKQAEQQADNDDEDELRLLGNLGHIELDVDAAILLGHEGLDDVGVACVGE